MIINWIFRLTSWFTGLWNGLDEKTKRQIIEVVIKAFEQLLRAFYKNMKN